MDNRSTLWEKHRIIFKYVQKGISWLAVREERERVWL